MGNGANAWLTFFALLAMIALVICLLAVAAAGAFTAASYWLFGAKGLLVGGLISLVALFVAFRYY